MENTVKGAWIFILGVGWLVMAVLLLTGVVQLSTVNSATGAPGKTLATALPDPAAIRVPYDHYVLTQGLHGQSYGQLAIDLGNGKGAPILSPITGQAAKLYTDQYGSPTLILENDVYIVTLMHGEYSVQAGEQVKIGEVIGKESNIGLTTDYQGVPCYYYHRACGYHTHLNIFDKRTGQNADPLTLLGIQP